METIEVTIREIILVVVILALIIIMAIIINVTANHELKSENKALKCEAEKNKGDIARLRLDNANLKTTNEQMTKELNSFRGKYKNEM